MAGLQRIVVLTTAADAADVERVRRRLGRDPLVLTAPTVEARGIVTGLGAERSAGPVVEVLLAPVPHPTSDRGHQLDLVVRRHALADRFRDVVVVTDPASSTLLVRVLAPDQLAERTAVTVVGLPRRGHPVAVSRAVVVGAAVGFVSSLTGSVLTYAVLAVVAIAPALGLMVAERSRHLAYEVLIGVAVGAAVLVLVVASSARFPGTF